MIPILFSPTTTNFTTNGVGRLSDAITCVVHEARNGEFELEMAYPVDGAHYDGIVHSAIIVAKPSARRNIQAFRVYKITKPISGRITVLAQHISYQLSLIPVSPFSADNLTNALDGFRTNAAEECPFVLTADFTRNSSYAVPLPTSIRSYLGGQRGSILDIYGGEWEWDNYHCILHGARGQDNGYVIRYGKNLTSLTQEESIENTYTGIYPYWNSDEVTVMLPEKVIHADTAQNFPFQRTLVKDFSDQFETAPTVDQLRAFTVNYIENNNIGIPSVSLSVDFVNLPDTEEYRDLLTTGNLDLCDTVTVRFEKLCVDVKSKVVDIKWNVLKDRYDKIEIGDRRSTLSDTIEDQIEQVSYMPTAAEVATMVDRATGVLNAGRGGHIIMNRNPEGWANELLAMNNENMAAATRVLRINMNGIGFANSYAGPYSQAWTMDGTLSLGGVNNSYGNLVILDQNGNVIGRWNKDGIYANGGSLVIGSKFAVDTNGNLWAVDGTFSGNINGSTISGSRLLSSQIGTLNDEFYVTENGDHVEIGFSGFDCWDEKLRTNWIGGVTNPATGGSDAGINGKNGDAGFRRLFLLDPWYAGSDGMWDVTRTIRWLDNRLTDLENFCRRHDWDDDDDDDPGTNDDDYIDDGPVY